MSHSCHYFQCNVDLPSPTTIHHEHRPTPLERERDVLNPPHLLQPRLENLKERN
jgi:hypothetical protein